MIDVAILTYEKLLTPDPQSFHTSYAPREESLLLDYFQKEGIKAKRISWSDDTVNWSDIGCAVFRSTWNYQHKLPQFKNWLEYAKTKTRLVNSYDTIKWNLDKHYLLELEKAGIKIIPTLFIEAHSQSNLERFFTHFENEELVIKPVVSAGGIDTYRVSRKGAVEFEHKFQELLSTKAMIIQPFEKSIQTQGELSFVIIDGRFTHAVQKTAKTGEFRIQDEYGGQVVPYTANAVEKAFAEKIMKAYPEPVHYARVDAVYDNQNKLAVMEVELFEPELFFRFNPPAADKLAQAIIS